MWAKQIKIDNVLFLTIEKFQARSVYWKNEYGIVASEIIKVKCILPSNCQGIAKPTTWNRQGILNILIFIKWFYSTAKYLSPLYMDYWPSMRSRWLDTDQVFCVLMDWDGFKVHNLAKKGRGQYPVILTEQAWLIQDLLYGFQGNFSCRKQRVVPGGQDSYILSAWVTNHSAGFDSSCPLKELAIQ